MNADANFARAWRRVRQRLVLENVGGAELVDDDRFHALPLPAEREPSVRDPTAAPGHTIEPR
jgi:hypothetical protein